MKSILLAIFTLVSLCAAHEEGDPVAPPRKSLSEEQRKEMLRQLNGLDALFDHYYTEWLAEMSRVAVERATVPPDGVPGPNNLFAIVRDMARTREVVWFSRIVELPGTEIKLPSGQVRKIEPASLLDQLARAMVNERKRKAAQQHLERSKKLEELATKAKSDPRALEELARAIGDFNLYLRYESGEPLPLSQSRKFTLISISFRQASPAEILRAVAIQCDCNLRYSPPELKEELKKKELSMRIEDKDVASALDEITKPLGASYKLEEGPPGTIVIEAVKK